MKYLECDELTELNSILERNSEGSCTVYGKIELYSCKKTNEDKKLSKHIRKTFQDSSSQKENLGAKNSNNQISHSINSHNIGAVSSNIPVPQKGHGQNIQHLEKLQPMTLEDESPRNGTTEVNVLSPLQTALQTRNVQMISSTWPPTNFYLSATSPPKTANIPLSSPSLPSPIVDQKTIECLIGTLNLSFPDYDFRNVKPQDFVGNINQHNALQTIQSSLRDVLSPEQFMKLWTVLEKVVNIKECDIILYEPLDQSDDFDPLIGNRTRLWGWSYFFYHRKLKKILFFTSCGTNSMESDSDDEDEKNLMEDDEMDQEMFAIDEEERDTQEM